jgi:hypothetical protein
MEFDHDDFKQRLAAARAGSDQFSAMLRENELLAGDTAELAATVFNVGALMKVYGAERMNALGYLVGIVVAAVDSAYGVVEDDDE